MGRGVVNRGTCHVLCFKAFLHQNDLDMPVSVVVWGHTYYSYQCCLNIGCFSNHFLLPGVDCVCRRLNCTVIIVSLQQFYLFHFFSQGILELLSVVMHEAQIAPWGPKSISLEWLTVVWRVKGSGWAHFFGPHEAITEGRQNQGHGCMLK